MRFAIFTILSFLAVALAATMPQKAVIVSYAEDCPDHIIDEAKAAIVAAGGVITHSYTLIKGFAAKAPAKVLETVQTLGTQYQALVEEDQIVTIAGNGD